MPPDSALIGSSVFAASPDFLQQVLHSLLPRVARKIVERGEVRQILAWRQAAWQAGVLRQIPDPACQVALDSAQRYASKGDGSTGGVEHPC